MFNVGNPEILQIADAVAREKSITRESVLDAMEQAIQVAGRRKYGHKHNIKAEIDRKTGSIRLFRVFDIVEKEEEVENITTQITIDEAKERSEDAKVGGVVYEELPPIDLGRVAAQAAKQVIVQKVRDVEKERQYNEFITKVGQIMNGVVKRNEYGNIIVDFGRDEAIIPKNEVIPGENFKQNDRVRMLVKEVKRENRGFQIIMSRTDNQFLAKLFEQEVPEIYDNIIQIKSIAREPGSRAKIAVYCEDNGIDPVGSCVGVRGARVQAIINELQGEKIDIIKWSADPAVFVVNALAPAEPTKVVINEEAFKIEVVVPNDHLSLAIGKKGQNVRLASRLVGWKIDVLTEEEESKRRSEEFSSSTNMFIEALDVEEVIAQLLVVEGYASIEDIVYSPISELVSIEGFEEELVLELKARAQKYLDNKNKTINKKIVELGVDESIVNLLKLEPKYVLRLAENGIKKIEDLADISVEEFMGIIPELVAHEKDIEKILSSVKNYN